MYQDTDLPWTVGQAIGRSLKVTFVSQVVNKNLYPLYGLRTIPGVGGIKLFSGALVKKSDTYALCSSIINHKEKKNDYFDKFGHYLTRKNYLS